MPSLTTGDLVPDFALPTDEGETVSAAALRGSPYVLWVYPKADTSGCTMEAGDFTALKPEFDALGVALVGLSPDPVRKLARFRSKHGLAGTLASDEERALIGALGLWVEKSMYGRSYMGAERTTLVVDREGRVARLWAGVRVPGHAAEVLAAARDLVAG